jgi:predicted outer membrane protein
MPALTGNIVGGVALVSVLNHAQVVSGKQREDYRQRVFSEQLLFPKWTNTPARKGIFPLHARLRAGWLHELLARKPRSGLDLLLLAFVDFGNSGGCLITLGLHRYETRETNPFGPNLTQRKRIELMNKTVTLLSAALMVSGIALVAQTGSSDRITGPGSPDRNFMMRAAQGGMAEVKLGQLATQNAENQAVKDFGQKMVDDHSKANDELKGLADQKTVTLPTDLDAKDQATYDRLSKLNGAAFDKAYMKDMLLDHRRHRGFSARS